MATNGSYSPEIIVFGVSVDVLSKCGQQSCE